MADRDRLLADLARAEARLAAAQTEAAEAAAEVAHLRQAVAATPCTSRAGPGHDRPQLPSPSVASSAAGRAVPTTNAGKVTLFRTLFRGRPDVFPRRWENHCTGRSGYAPVCTREWEEGVCQKQRGRKGSRRATCSECPHRSFLPVTDEQVAAHLRGDHVMGVYPLLADDTCWFLAADFDQASWQEDVAAFRQTCHREGVPVAVERSRSGAGAHAWLFFAGPVPAAVARQLGSFLVTQTMAQRHQLAMSSYDRLFPSQDTLPRGGFGGLIALPLQRGARDQGNTLFVDDELGPFADQWAFLAGVDRLDAARVQRLAADAAHRGPVLGTGLAADHEGDLAPWQRPLNRPSVRPALDGPLPAAVSAVLAQRLLVVKEGVPSSLLNELKRLASFANPEFHQRESQRRSTHRIPRVITCAEELPEHLALPRGCLAAAQALLQERGTVLVVDDQRDAGAPLGVRFEGELTPVQREAAAALLAHDTGVLVAPPGMGKTVIGAYLVAARGTSTLVLVHRKPLLDQWVAQLAVFLGLDPQDIGQVGGGRRRPTGRIDVALYQSLVHRGQVSDLVHGYGQLICDEAHHGSSVSFERVLAAVKARYVVGLTATPTRCDGHHPIVHLQLGPVRFRVDARTQAAAQPFAHHLIVRETGFVGRGLPADPSIQELYAALRACDELSD